MSDFQTLSFNHPFEIFPGIGQHGIRHVALNPIAVGANVDLLVQWNAGGLFIPEVLKSGVDFSCRSRDKIKEQLIALREFYGKDLPGYASLLTVILFRYAMYLP